MASNPMVTAHYVREHTELLNANMGKAYGDNGHLYVARVKRKHSIMETRNGKGRNLSGVLLLADLAIWLDGFVYGLSRGLGRPLTGGKREEATCRKT